MPGQQVESGARSPGRAPQTNPAAPRERIQARAYEIFQARKNNGRQATRRRTGCRPSAN
jgi:hypothetical protein